MIEASKKHGATQRRFKPYPEYEDSGVDWLGEIPTHWVVVPFKRRLSSVKDGTHGSFERVLQGVPLLSAKNIGVDGRLQVSDAESLISEADYEQINRNGYLRRGDLLLTIVGTIGRAAVFDQLAPVAFQRSVAVLRPTDELSVHFLLHQSQAGFFQHALQHSSKRSAQGGVYLSDVAELPLLCPPQPEQRTIAAFLDRETARIDALVAKKERLIELLQEEHIALITRAVTKGLDPNVPTKDSGVEWLGGIPAHWEVKRLWHLTPSDRRIMYGIVLPGPNVDDGVPIVKGGDVSPERLRLERLNRTTREIESGYVRSRLRGGDLVYAIRGSIGEVAMVPNELQGANLTQDAARIAYTSATHGPWLVQALKSSAVFAQLEAGALGATIRGINIRDLKRTSMAVPPLAEQRAIADFLDRESARIDALVARVRDAMDGLKELRAALISAAVTGKIDVRGEVA